MVTFNYLKTIEDGDRIGYILEVFFEIYYCCQTSKHKKISCYVKFHSPANGMHFSKILGIPDPPEYCKVDSKTSTSVTLQCDVGFDGGSKLSYLLHVHRAHHKVRL